MIYDKCLVDVANTFYRLQNGQKQSLTIVRKMINFIEQEIKPHLNGVLYLLFDPLNLSDLGESKNFTVSLTERKKILPDYKAGRVYSALYNDSIELFRKYYIHRGENIQLIYSDEFEADDYVEPLLKTFSSSDKVALISNDLDFARYITENIHLINTSFQKPYTIQQFEEVFQFKPTIAANTIYKALFGDKSDNIQGALFIKKARFNINIKVLTRDYIQLVSKENMTIDDVLKQFKNANFMQINNKTEKSIFDLLYLQLSIVDLKVPILEKFYTNIRVIRSSLSETSIKQFIHWNPEQPKTNDIIHQSIFGIKFSTMFGKI